ncbi:MAG: type II secretion system F family protein [Nocardioidaceae bacterium]
MASLACLVPLGAVAAGGPGQGWSARAGLGVSGTVAVVLVVRRLLAQRRNREVRHANQLAVIGLCDALSAELRAGTPATQALAQACRQRADWSPLRVTSHLGGDVAGGLRGLADRPGQRGLAAVAAAWEVSARSGLALADMLDRVAEVLRDEQDARGEVTATLAPARATAKLLAGLPVFGLVLGSSVGARPLHVLLATPLGIGCLASGAALAVLGVLWVEHISDAAEN